MSEQKRKESETDNCCQHKTQEKQDIQNIPCLSQTVYGSLPSSAVASQQADTSLAGMHEAALKIGGMTCEGCASAIEYALKEKPGVIRANVTYPKGMGTVIYNSTQITETGISQTITGLGYAAEVMQDRVR